ncbi:MAG: hypothetical protein ACYTFA_11545 [Planctomycetota bacterium]
METLSLSEADLCHHVVTLGMDIYPQVDIPTSRTHLNMFYEEARDRYGRLFERLSASDTEFRISKLFRRQPNVEGPSIPVATFVLNPRGPVFVFPLKLPEPVGETGLESTFQDDFDQLRELFFRALTQRVVMRVGLIRELIFETGQANCQELITDVRSFANAPLVGGQATLKYRDDNHNHNIVVEPVSIARTTQLPMGARVSEDAGYGVHVVIDVNNANIQRPLEKADIDGVLERATSLWPDILLEYLRGLPRSTQP